MNDAEFRRRAHTMLVVIQAHDSAPMQPHRFLGYGDAREVAMLIMDGAVGEPPMVPGEWREYNGATIYFRSAADLRTCDPGWRAYTVVPGWPTGFATEREAREFIDKRQAERSAPKVTRGPEGVPPPPE